MADETYTEDDYENAKGDLIEMLDAFLTIGIALGKSEQQISMEFLGSFQKAMAEAGATA